MNSKEIITLLINIIVPLISSFLGAFLGYRFSLKQRSAEQKMEVYNKLLAYLPVDMPISQGDILQNYLSAGPPESSIRILQIQITDYEKQLKDLNHTPERKRFLETEISNSRYAINQLEQYIEFFNKTMQTLSEFEHSQFFNQFKIYANSDVRKSYIQFSVAISNDYHSCINIQSKALNTLLDKLLFAIKCDMNK